jgi:hypothetical protein
MRAETRRTRREARAKKNQLFEIYFVRLIGTPNQQLIKI